MFSHALSSATGHAEPTAVPVGGSCGRGGANPLTLLTDRHAEMRNISMPASRYLRLELPERFYLDVRSETGDWLVHGRYRADEFGRAPNGAYVCSVGIGLPTYLRVLSQDGDEIVVEDGGGDRFVYRIRAEE